MATAEAVQLRKVVSTNPATGEVLAELGCASEAEVRAAVAKAREAQRGWAACPTRERLNVLREFQRRLHADKDEVAALISREAGKPEVEALLTEIVVILDAVAFYVKDTPGFLSPQPVRHGNPVMKGKRAWLERGPFGVIGIISPWNYPFSIPASEILPALACGNAVALKPSELTPLCALKLKELFDAAGLPAGVLEVVVGDGITGAALIGSDIDKLVFTGSVATGRRIAQAAAAREKLLPVVLELGGKDAMVVLEDADLEVASAAAVWGAFMNAGQTCLSVERCYVHRSLHDRFVEKCVAKTERLHVGPGSDPASDVGPLISQNQLRTVTAHVEDALQQGAQVRTGGSRMPQFGPNFYAPTILTGVTAAMKIMREESFGPLLPIVPFADDDEAVKLANESEFGLAASIWTRDRRRGEALAQRIEAGTVMVNDVITCFGIREAPHGGSKQSGIGRMHGRFGMEEMVRVKYVDSDRMPGMKKIWWYGYGAEFREQMRGFVDSLFAPGMGKKLRGGLRSFGALRRKNQL